LTYWVKEFMDYHVNISVVVLPPKGRPRGRVFSNSSYPPSLGVIIEFGIKGVNTVKKIPYHFLRKLKLVSVC
jgi:hypothetical protein